MTKASTIAFPKEHRPDHPIQNFSNGIHEEDVYDFSESGESPEEYSNRIELTSCELCDCLYDHACQGFCPRCGAGDSENDWSKGERQWRKFHWRETKEEFQEGKLGGDKKRRGLKRPLDDCERNLWYCESHQSIFLVHEWACRNWDSAIDPIRDSRKGEREFDPTHSSIFGWVVFSLSSRRISASWAVPVQKATGLWVHTSASWV